MRGDLMNIKEVIKEIEYLIGDGVVLEHIVVNLPQESIEALKVARNACERQIAKELKIIESDVIISGQIYHDDYYHCPCCDKCFGTLWYVEDNAKTLKTKCCPDCGQELDWE